MADYMLVFWLLVLVFLIAELTVFAFSRPRSDLKSFEYIVLLGANGSITSAVTQDRARNAALALSKWPQAKLIVTGNESKGEVTAYRTLLQSHGITNFIAESKSRNTWENMRFSICFLENDKNILIVTSQYHQPRALAMIRSLGFQANAFGVDSIIYERRYFFFLKERLSNVRYWPHILSSYFRGR